MLLPGSLLDTLLFVRALGTLIASLLLGVLLLVVLALTLLLLGVLLLVVLALTLLLLSLLLLLCVPLLLCVLLLLCGLLLVVLVLTLLLLRMLLLSRLLLLSGLLWLLLLTLRLSMLLLGLGLLVLALLLLGMVLLCALLVLLCIRRSGDSEKQRQNGCAGDSNYFHRCYLQNYSVRVLALAQASCCRVDRAAYGFAGHEKFNSPVLLPSGGVIV